MGLATVPITNTSATVAAAGTSVAPATAIPDNCHTIIIYNPHATATLYWGIGTPGAALTPGTGATSVPPGASTTLPIGTYKDRGVMDNAATAGSGIVYDGTAAITPQITYLNKFGPL